MWLPMSTNLRLSRQTRIDRYVIFTAENAESAKASALSARSVVKSRTEPRAGVAALKLRISLMIVLLGVAAAAFADQPSVVLGRPTDRSITLNVLSSSDVDIYAESGTTAGAYALRTATKSLSAGVPQEIVLTGLEPDRDYAYRLQYAPRGSVAFTPGNDRRFHTARGPGSTFTFAIEADPHLDNNTNLDLFARSLSNVLSFNPDFLVDLGDTFMSEKLANTRDTSLARYKLLRSYFDATCHSVPLFLVQGNHDGEAGWYLDGTPDNMAVWTTNMRKQYFSGPEPDAFYSGDKTSYPNVGLRQAVYSWEWGNALFVVLDPFWATTNKGGYWNFTLGKTQYDWLASVLQQSHATFKFVFIHHLVGGVDSQARGGTEAVPFFEWGGKSLDKSEDFAAQRKGWAAPIHKLLVDNHVTIVFHGHDHFYGYQSIDGIVYQEVPQPGWPGTSLPDPASYGYLSGIFMASSGDLRLTVSPDRVKVEYVRSLLPQNETATRKNGDVVHSYTIDAPGTVAAPRKRAVRP